MPGVRGKHVTAYIAITYSMSGGAICVRVGTLWHGWHCPCELSVVAGTLRAESRLGKERACDTQFAADQSGRWGVYQVPKRKLAGARWIPVHPDRRRPWQ